VLALGGSAEALQALAPIFELDPRVVEENLTMLATQGVSIRLETRLS